MIIDTNNLIPQGNDSSSANDRFIKQRRNLVIVSLAAILHQGKHSSLALSWLGQGNDESFQYISAILLLSLIYLCLRYFQAMLQNKDFYEMKTKLGTMRDGYLRLHHSIHVERSRGGNVFPKWDDDFKMKFKTIVTMDLDNEGELTIIRKNEATPLTGWRKYQFRIGLIFKSIIPFFKFILLHISPFEFFFPILLCVFAFLELLGFSIGNSLIVKTANALEHTMNDLVALSPFTA